MRSVPLLRYRCGISFSSRPTPSRSLLSLCLLELFPRPRGVGGVGCCRFAAAGIAAICLLASFPYRSLALARSLLPSAPPSSSSVCSSLAGGCGDAVSCVPLASSVGGPPRFPFPVPPSCPPDGEGMAWCCLLAFLIGSVEMFSCGRAVLSLGRVRCRGVCGELDETARVPMIGLRRFSFSRHLVFDTG